MLISCEKIREPAAQMKPRKNKVQRAIPNLFGENSVSTYASMLGRHRVTLYRAISDPHSMTSHLADLLCVLLIQARQHGGSPRDIFGADLPEKYSPEDCPCGRTPVDHALRKLLGPGSIDLLAVRLTRPHASVINAISKPSSRNYAHFERISVCLDWLHDNTDLSPNSAISCKLLDDLTLEHQEVSPQSEVRPQ